MTTFIKTKFKNQTNIDKYRVAANNIEYHIISKLILLRIIVSMVIDFTIYTRAPDYTAKYFNKNDNIHKTEVQEIRQILTNIE